MNELMRLIRDSVRHDRRAMAQAAHADAADEIHVFFALVVPDRHAAAGNQLHRFAGERMHDVFVFELLLFFK